jgi:hypothetical protein
MFSLLMAKNSQPAIPQLGWAGGLKNTSAAKSKVSVRTTSPGSLAERLQSAKQRRENIAAACCDTVYMISKNPIVATLVAWSNGIMPA